MAAGSDDRFGASKNPIPFLDDGHPADLSLKNRGGSGPLAPPQPPIAIVAVAALPDQKPQISSPSTRKSRPVSTASVPGMRVRRAHHQGMGLVREVQIDAAWHWLGEAMAKAESSRGA
jgi:hypothetical protein